MKTRNIAGFVLAVGAYLARPMAAQDDAPCKFEAPGQSDFGPAFEGAIASGQEKSPSVESVREGGTKHFFRAAGELALLEVGPWAFDRYIHPAVLPERRAHPARRTDRRRSRLRLVQPEDELPRLFRAPQDAVGVAPVPRCILRISMNRPSPEGPAPRL